MNLRTGLALWFILSWSLGCSDETDAPGGQDASTLHMDAGTSDANSNTDGSTIDASTEEDGGVADPDASSVDSGLEDAGLLDGGSSSGDGCPSYLGIVEGRIWHYQSTEAYEILTGSSFTSSVEVISIENEGDHITVQTQVEQELTGPGYSTITMGTTTSQCDETGHSIVSSTFSAEAVVGKTTSTSTGSTVYNPPLLTAIRSPQEGQSWTRSSEVTSTVTTDGQTFENTSVQEFNWFVLSPGTVTTPAGQFSNTIQLQLGEGEMTSITHYVDPIGMVANNSSELTSYE